MQTREVDGAERAFVTVRLASDPTDEAGTTQELRRLIDGMNDAVMIVDVNGEFVDANQVAVDRLGYTRSELLSMGPADISPPEHSNQVSERMQRIEQEDHLVFESVQVTADGEEIPVEINASHITYHGEPAILSVARDISRRKERTRWLRTFEQAVEQAGHAVYITDTDGTIQYVNPAFEESTGYDKTAALGKTPAILSAGTQEQSYYEELWETVLAGDVWQEEIANERADGERYYADQTIAPIVEDGDVVNFVAVQQDVTERERTRDRLEQQNEQLEILNRVVRHDIRNDMTVILSHAQLLREYVDSEGQEYLDSIAEHGDHAVELTKTVRELMETMLDDGPVEAEAIDLSQVLTAELADARAGYDADFTVDGTVPDVCVTANEMLSSVFRNLLNNAVQHNNSDEPEVTVSVDTGEESVLVHIADNGPGIPDAQKTDIFGQGEQGIGSSGTGLGLYLVYTFIEQFGGDVWVTDNDPQGAVFHVELPLAE
jgi:PAS domain S-box-containing protein